MAINMVAKIEKISQFIKAWGKKMTTYRRVLGEEAPKIYYTKSACLKTWHQPNLQSPHSLCKTSHPIELSYHHTRHQTIEWVFIWCQSMNQISATTN